uniref:Uncharacterized protein n=1 Tax=Timema poppense TaxID=170557 RepID=A0A7R9DXA7_TIMPO|nr:unnamed protein product [Timema poppensis]
MASLYAASRLTPPRDHLPVFTSGRDLDQRESWFSLELEDVATFLSLHRSTAELLDEVSHWGEARPTFDQENFRIDLQDDLANGTNADDADDIDENSVDEARKFKPELIKNADDMCLYYRSRPFSARALLGHALLHRPAGVGLAPWGGGSHVYVAGTDNNQVLVFDLTKGRLLQRLTAPNMKCPQGLTFCPRRMEIYVTGRPSTRPVHPLEDPRC